MNKEVKAIRAEVERRINLIQDTNLTSYADGWVCAYKDLLPFIDSMDKEESDCTDLSEYIDKLSKQFPEVSFAKLSRIAVRVARWQKEHMDNNIELYAGGNE